MEAAVDFRRSWPQLVLTDLLARAVAVIILAPTIGFLGRLFLLRTSSRVVTDEAIVSFILHPFGFAALVTVGAVIGATVFIESGQLMVIGFGAIEDRRVSWLAALTYTYRRLAAMVELAGHALVRMLLISAPFLAVVGGIYWLLVRAHDINYYLARRPPQFTFALIGAGIVLGALALVLLSRIAAWLYAIPLVLFERMQGRRALRTSSHMTAGRRRRLTMWLLGWVLIVIVSSVVVTNLVGWLGALVFAPASSNLTLLVVGLSGVIVIGGLANLALSVLVTILFALLVVRLYRATAGPGKLEPEIAAAGSLGQNATFRIPGKVVLFACASVLILAVGGVFVSADDPEWRDPTEIIAHRGGAWVAPENSIAAFERAIASGADWLELDVQENADGEVIVEHDRDFMRSAGVRLEVWRAKSAEIAELDIGSSFAPEFAGQRVPTLREVLELSKGRVGVFIELKYYGRDVNLEHKVVDLVEETGMVSDVVIMSLNYEGLRKTAALRPEWTYGLLNAVALGDLTRLEVDFLALTSGATTVPLIRRAHKRGLDVYPWTINDPVQMWVMMSRGADGIITDRVLLANRIKEIREEVTPIGRFIIWMAGEFGLLRNLQEPSTEEDA
jgi:glycerophosphoryl diester phosphodiesterase